jgi:signal peptidase II
VTDFLDVDYWPAFNLADTFIVVGVSLLVGAALIADRPRSRPR